MQQNPSSNAVALAIAGLVTIVVGVALGIVPVVAWGGGIWIGLAIARAVTLLNVAEIRAAGFEMLWREEQRVLQVACGQSVELQAEVRNRDRRAARYSGLRVVANPNLRVTVSPSDGEVPAFGRLGVSIRIEALRVGHHGIHGLSLDVRGGPGLFEVPLTFANPFGIEVVPSAYSVRARSPRGGRSRRFTEQGQVSKRRGEAGEFAEVRDHQVGDPFKHIAWRASARRGKLLVREHDSEERSIVWLLFDASTELWAGKPGFAPLDLAIQEAAVIADQHLRAGDAVGLTLIGSRVLNRLPPQTGPAALAKILFSLAFDSQTHDADRSGIDEAAVATRVLEHMRPLEPELAREIQGHEIDRIARHASVLLDTAPFALAPPEAASDRERTLRHYLRVFGVASPPRQESDRVQADAVLCEALEQIAHERPHPGLIYVCSPAPDPVSRGQIETTLKKLPKQRLAVSWVPTEYAPGLDALSHESGSHSAPLRAVTDAIKLRMQVLARSGETSLRRLGVKIERSRARRSLDRDLQRSGDEGRKV